MANPILVIADVRGDSVKRITLETLTAARKLANALGSTVTAAVIGNNLPAGVAGPVGQAGADEVILAQSPDLAEYAVESYTDAVQQVVEHVGPAVVIMAASPRGRDMSGRVAARLGVALASDVTAIEMSGNQIVVTRPVFSGNAIASVALETSPAIVTMRAGSYPPAQPDAGRSAKVTQLPITIEYAPGARAVEFHEVKSARPDVSEAAIVVAGGRGMGSPDNFDKIEELADLLGAAVGASRAVVDSGWRPYGEQVGQTGKTVSPKLYIACGISGAIQHLVGMKTSKYIVAINKDPEAPIFKVADYGIVGDVLTLLPMLTTEVKKAKAQG